MEQTIVVYTAATIMWTLMAFALHILINELVDGTHDIIKNFRF